MPTCNLGPCWTASPFDGTNFDTLSATTFNNLWIIGGQNNTNGRSVIQYSSDGINWTRVDVGYAGGGGVRSFASGNGILIGIVNFAYHITSTDGMNWTIVPHFPPVSAEVGFAFGAGNFVLTVNASDEFAYSPDGSFGSWNITPCSPFSYYYMDRARIYGAGLFVSVGRQGFGVTPSVNTPITAINYPVGAPTAGEVAYGGGAFIAFTGTRSVYRSLDGYNWTLLVDVLPIAPDGAIDYWRSVIYSQGYFLCCRLDSKYLTYSPDGITWTLTSGDHLFDSPLNSGYGILETNDDGQYIAVRTTSNISQVGICPCSTPISYGEYWVRAANISMQNVQIKKYAPQQYCDQYWNEITFLLSGNGSPGGTTVIDDGPLSLPFTTEWGTWTYTATQNKYYPTSLIGSQTGALSTVIPASGSNKSWTVELWFYATAAALAGSGGGMSFLANNNAEWILGTIGPANGGNNQLNLSNGPLGASYAASPSGIPADQWVYLTMTFEDITGEPGHSGILRTFINGILVASYGGDGFTPYDWRDKIWIGPNSPPFFTENNYYFSDYRFTRGVARYTSSFTPPDLPLPLVSCGPPSPEDYYWTLAGGNINFTTLYNNGEYSIFAPFGIGQFMALRSKHVIIGKRYCEFEVTAAATNAYVAFGVTEQNADLFYNNGNANIFTGNGGCGLNQQGLYNNSSNFTADAKYNFAVGDRIGIAFDASTKNLWISKNGTWLDGDPSTLSGPSMTVALSGYLYFYHSQYTCTVPGNKITYIYPDAASQNYTAPTGFVPYAS